MVTLQIPGEPIAQPRQRHGLVNGHVRNWTPAKHPANTYKAQIRLAWQEAAGERIDGPVRLSVLLVFSRPQGRVWKTKAMPRYPHTSRPDAENVVKAVQDALTGLAWRDDSQVAALSVETWVAAGDEQPGSMINIRPV